LEYGDSVQNAFMSSQDQAGDAQPHDDQPDTGQPDTGQPDTGQPDTGQPDTGQPADEQPADEQPADEQPADEQPADEQPAADQPQDERIAEVAEHIDKARSQAEDAGILVDPDAETFADSGTTDSQDDQTIAPPG
jgi:hypothetical protein